MPKDKDLKEVLTEALNILANMREKNRPYEQKADNFLKSLEYHEAAVPPEFIDNHMELVRNLNEYADKRIMLLQLLQILVAEKNLVDTPSDYLTGYRKGLEVAIEKINELLEKIKPPS